VVVSWVAGAEQNSKCIRVMWSGVACSKTTKLRKKLVASFGNIMSPCKSQENLTVEAYVETVSQRFTTLQLHDLEPAKAMKDGTSEEDSDDIVP